MNSRQRVLAAIEHQPFDRVPANYLGTPEIDGRLREHFHLSNTVAPRAGDTVPYDWDIQDSLGTDLRTLRLGYQGPPIPSFKDGRVQNVFGVIRRPVRNEAGLYMESCHTPYAAFQSVDDVEGFGWPDPDWYAYEELPAQCHQLDGCAIVYGWPGNVDLINGTSFGLGFEQTIIAIATDDPVGLRIMDKRFEFCHEQTRRALEACQGKIDIVWIGDNFGTQRGLLLSAIRWRKVFRPKVQSMIDLAHSYGAKLMLHSCGSTRPCGPILSKWVWIFMTRSSRRPRAWWRKNWPRSLGRASACTAR